MQPDVALTPPQTNRSAVGWLTAAVCPVPEIVSGSEIRDTDGFCSVILLEFACEVILELLIYSV